MRNKYIFRPFLPVVNPAISLNTPLISFIFFFFEGGFKKNFCINNKYCFFCEKTVDIYATYKYYICKIAKNEGLMAKYKKCERCELNWIPVEEDLCEVCKAELGRESKIHLIEDDEDENILGERICPICKENYLEDGEDICSACRHEREKQKEKEKAEDNWDFEDDVIEDEEEELSLNALQEEEIEEDFDDEEEENRDDLDFDESFVEFKEGDYDEDEEDEDDDL